MATAKITTKVTRMVTYEIPDTDIESILSTAGYTIGYWADNLSWDSDARTFRLTEVADLSKDEYVVHEGTYQDIVDAIMTVDKEWGGTYSHTYVNRYFNEFYGIDAEYAVGEIDGEAADVIVQIAALGEYTYG